MAEEEGPLMARIARRYLVQFLLASLLAFAAGGTGRAQQSSMDTAAAQMAEAISHSKAKTVVVFDFAGPGEKVTALGQRLADDFRAALAKSGGTFQVEDQSQIAGLTQENDFTLGVIQDQDTALWFAHGLGAGALIWGNVSMEGDEIKIALDSYRVDKRKKTGSFELRLPITDEMKALIGKSADADLWANIPESGKNGYSLPACIRCPEPKFTNEAVKNKFSKGSVMLVIVISEDGQVKDVKVLKALPYGLTQTAVEAVRSWQFKPVTDPTGKPAEAKQFVEVNFHLMRFF
jgi:TonB family protein